MASNWTQGSFVASLKAPPDITCNLLYLVRLTNSFVCLLFKLYLYFLIQHYSEGTQKLLLHHTIALWNFYSWARSQACCPIVKQNLFFRPAVCFQKKKIIVDLTALNSIGLCCQSKRVNARVTVVHLLCQRKVYQSILYIRNAMLTISLPHSHTQESCSTKSW